MHPFYLGSRIGIWGLLLPSTGYDTEAKPQGKQPKGQGHTHHQRAPHSTPGTVSASSSILQSLMKYANRGSTMKPKA